MTRIHPLRRLGRDLHSVLHDLPTGSPSTAATGPDDPRLRRAARSISELYGVMAVGVALWVVYLAFALPERNLSLHYDITWVGFDLFIVGAMAATAWCAYRLDPAVQLAANATATLMLVDAWFDITTSSSNAALLVAIAFAVFLELPTALLSLRIARNVNRAIAARARAVGAGDVAAGADGTSPAPDVPNG